MSLVSVGYALQNKRGHTFAMVLNDCDCFNCSQTGEMEEPDGGKAVTASVAESSQPKISKHSSKDPLTCERLPASSADDSKLVEQVSHVHLNEALPKTVSTNGTAEPLQLKSLSADSKAKLGSEDGILEGEEAELDYEEDEGEIIDPEVAGDSKGAVLEDGELEEGELEEREEGETSTGSEAKVRNVNKIGYCDCVSVSTETVS